MAVDIESANREALERLCRARPTWTAVRSAGDALALEERTLLHSGPPIEWPRMCGPMQGAVIGATLYEGWAADAEVARKLATSGAIQFAPAHSRGAVAPMAAVISRTMPLLEIEDKANATKSWSFIGTGFGPQLRFGGFSPEVLEKLRWLRDVYAPALVGALEKEGPLDLAATMAQALQMGDEMHMRNAAGTALLARFLAPPLAAVVKDAATLERILRFMTRNNDQFFLAWSMGAAKAVARSIENVEGSTVVSTMARNGVDFGIRVAGLGERWFTAPAAAVAGSYFPGFGPDHANRDVGDSAIMETWGLGGMAMAASPAVVTIVGAKSFSDAVKTSRAMGEICVGRNALFPLAALGEGSPTAIDIRRVAESGIVPSINTAIAHRDAGVGRIIGAGIATPPLEPFVEALGAFADRYLG